MKSRLDFLRDRHQGETAVLVANGPSLNRMDLSFLRRYTTIGMNKIFLGLRRFCFYPKYYVAVNDLVIRQSAEQIKSLNCVKFIGCRGALLIPENALTYHVETRAPRHRFCKNLQDGVHEGWTVTYAALQICYFLGFHKVVIVGMDHRFKFAGEPNAPQHLSGPDPNHFSPDYFGGQKWDNPDLVRSEESYEIARKVFEADGRRIVDATVDGACTVFEKADYREMFNLH
ncbi:MAG TPA: hypothetical protein PLN31_05740 [Azoarcus taiwanensis]|nr:hypothetical protein [Azoarcus taiwanensis]